MSLVWLNIEPNQGPQIASAIVARRPARGPATSRAVAHTAAKPPMPIRVHSRCRTAKMSSGRMRPSRIADDVEKPTVKIEILVGEDGAFGEAAGVIGQDQFAVAVLNLFVVRYCVIAKRQQRSRQQHANQQPCCDIERVASPPARPGVRPRSFCHRRARHGSHRERCCIVGWRAPDFTCGMSAERRFIARCDHRPHQDQWPRYCC